MPLCQDAQTSLCCQIRLQLSLVLRVALPLLGLLSTALPALSIVASETEESPQDAAGKASWLCPQLFVSSLVALNCPEQLFKWKELSELL